MNSVSFIRSNKKSNFDVRIVSKRISFDRMNIVTILFFNKLFLLLECDLSLNFINSHQNEIEINYQFKLDLVFLISF